MQLISLLSKMTFDVGVCKKVLEECHELLHVNLINGELELCLIILNTCTRIAEECVFELSGHVNYISLKTVFIYFRLNYCSSTLINLMTRYLFVEFYFV